MTRTSTTDLFDAFADDLLEERAPRPLVIVATAKVDDLLLQILGQYLRPKIAKQKDQDELLEGDRPLATFGARIKLAYRLGLIDKTLYTALERLRTLRNYSAHSLDFDTAKSPTRERLASLRECIARRNSFHQTTKRYFGTSALTGIEELQGLLLSLCVLLEAIRRATKITRGNKRARGIASG